MEEKPRAFLHWGTAPNGAPAVPVIGAPDHQLADVE